MNTATRGIKSPLNHDPEALAWALSKSGLTQSAFAAQLGKSPSLVSEILKGTRNATPSLMADMAQVLNCPIVVLEAKRAEAVA